MSHVKGGGSTKLGRDSAGQRLGVKRFGGQAVAAGSILVRQRGTKIIAGPGATTGRDQTIFATQSGQVTYTKQRRASFTGRGRAKTIVSVK